MGLQKRAGHDLATNQQQQCSVSENGRCHTNPWTGLGKEAGCVGRDCGFKYGSQSRLPKKMSFHCLLTVTVSDSHSLCFFPMYITFSYLAAFKISLLSLVFCKLIIMYFNWSHLLQICWTSWIFGFVYLIKFITNI